MKIIATTCLLTTLISCGVQDPKVTKQSSGSIEVPQFEKADESFALSQKDFTIDFKGSALIWKNEFDPKTFKPTLDQSIAIKEADLSYKKAEFEDDALWVKYKASKDEASALSKKLNTKMTDKIDEFYALQAGTLMDNSGKWLDAQLTTNGLENTLPSFCDAYLVRFAVSDLVKNQTFRSRPTPVGMCENYYKAHGFFTHQDCAETHEAKDYFSCFWGETGVLKGGVEIANPDGSLLDLDASKALLASQSFRDYVQKKDRIILSTGRLEGGLKLMLAGKKELSQTLKNHPILGLNESLKQLLTKDISVQRTLRVTYNDRLFNLHLLKTGSEDASFAPTQDEELAALTQALPEVFGHKLPHFASMTPDERKALEDNIATLQKEQLDINAKRSAMSAGISDAMGKWLGLRDESGRYISAQELAEATWPYVDVAVEKKDSILRVSLQWDEEKGTGRFFGCYDLDRSESIECADKPALSMTVSFDQKTGMIQITKTLDDLMAFGMFEVAKSTTSSRYHLIPNSQTQGKNLVIDLYPRKYRGTLETLSGKVSLQDGGKDMYAGSIGLSRPGMASKQAPF